MFRTLKKINPFLLGTFLLIFSINSYFIFGGFVKDVLLLVGFLFIARAAYVCPKKNNLIKFSTTVVLYFVILILLSAFQNHKTFDLINNIFGLVCISMLIFGYVIGKNQHLFLNHSNRSTLIYCILTLLKSQYIFIFFYKTQK